MPVHDPPAEPTPGTIARLFQELGLAPPSRIYVFAGAWVEEGFAITHGARGRAPPRPAVRARPAEQRERCVRCGQLTEQWDFYDGLVCAECAGVR